MRILNATQSYAPFYEFGGPPAKVRALSEGLARLGHEVTVLTADWGLAERLRKFSTEVAGEDSDFGLRRRENGVTAVYLPNRFHYRALSWNPRVSGFLHSQIGNFDVAHIFGLYDLLGPAAAAACRARGLPYIVEPIGMFLPIVRNLWLKRMYHSVFGKRLLLGAKAVIATSEQEAAELAAGNIAQQKIVLRRNGVEIPARMPDRGSFRSARGIAQGAKLILFLGRLSRKKSPEMLLKAFSKLAGSLPGQSFQLLFAGPDEGGMKSRLEKLASEIGVASQVQFSGALFGEEKWSAYRDADVFVLPSQNENFGNTAGEAVAAGTPVVVTDQCGVAPFLDDLAGLVVKHDLDALTRALERLFQEPGLYSRLQAGCASVTSRLGWEQPVIEMESLYRSLVSAYSPTAEGRTLG